jgi:hypothetical protein
VYEQHHKLRPFITVAFTLNQSLNVPLFFNFFNFFIFNSSHENQFLLAGLKVEKLSSWTERQSAYLAATKAFLTKLKPEFATLPISYVKAIRHEPKLMLSVECAKAKQ